jgi:hypothetical protein
MRDFRNKPFPSRVKIEYYQNVLTVCSLYFGVLPLLSILYHGHPASYAVGSRESFDGGKLAGYVAGRSLPSS